MVTIPVPPQSIAFPADFLSLPAVVSIQYSLASCHMCHIPLPLETPVKRYGAYRAHFSTR